MVKFQTCLIQYSCHFDLYMNENVHERDKHQPMKIEVDKNKIIYFSNLPCFQERLDLEVP